MLVAQGGEMQRGRLLEATAAQGIDEFRVRVEALPSASTSPDCAAQMMPCTPPSQLRSGSGRLGHRARASRWPVTPLLGNLMHRAAVAIRRCRIEAGGEGTPDRLDIAGASGLEDAIAFGRRGLMSRHAP